MHVVLLTCACAWSASMDAHLQLIFILDPHDAFTSSQYNTHTHACTHTHTHCKYTWREREKVCIQMHVQTPHTQYINTHSYTVKSQNNAAIYFSSLPSFWFSAPSAAQSNVPTELLRFCSCCALFVWLVGWFWLLFIFTPISYFIFSHLCLKIQRQSIKLLFLTFGTWLVTLDAFCIIAVGQVSIGALIHTLPRQLLVLRFVQHPIAALGVGFAGQVCTLLCTQTPPLHEL